MRCTRPDYPKAPIAPGKAGKIKVTYNPLGVRAFTKVVTIKQRQPVESKAKYAGLCLLNKENVDEF